MENNQPKLVMPAIYNFIFEDYPDESWWGWHLASELYEAINNVRDMVGKTSLTTLEVVTMFDPIFGDLKFKSSYVVTQNGELATAFLGKSGNCYDWLGDCIKRDQYIPAKIGVRIIKDIKNPAKAALRKAIRLKII